MGQEQIIGTVVVLVIMIGLFLVCFIANRKTPKPEGCEDLEAECENCPITTCLKNTSKKEK
ncbi:MAG: hypothetical protein IJV94_02640 [Bacilli bacterium]|nr:hypothetical protein [Bacilli bacterium]